MQKHTHLKFMSGSNGSSTWWGKKDHGIEVKDAYVNEFRAYWMLVPVNVIAIKQLATAEERRAYHLKELRGIAHQIIGKLYAEFHKYYQRNRFEHKHPTDLIRTRCR